MKVFGYTLLYRIANSWLKFLTTGSYEKQSKETSGESSRLYAGLQSSRCLVLKTVL